MVPYVYDDATPCPPEADPDVLEVLAKARGKAAVVEAEAAVQALDADLRARFRQLTDLRSIRLVAMGVRDIIERRRIYAARAAGLRRALKLGASKIPPSPVLPDLGRLGDHDTRPGDLQRHIASQLELAKKGLAIVESEIKTWEAIVADDGQYSLQRMSLEPVPTKQGERPSEHTKRIEAYRRCWPQDACLERLVRSVGDRRKLLGRIAALEADATNAMALVARLVKAAVDQAGGSSAVIMAAIAADACTNLSSPSNIRALEAEKASREAALARLADAGVAEGPAVDRAHAELADIATQLAVARQESIDRRRAVASATVERALLGDEAARAQLERLATDYPIAFAGGFASAMSAARWDHAAFAEVLSTIPA